MPRTSLTHHSIIPGATLLFLLATTAGVRDAHGQGTTTSATASSTTTLAAELQQVLPADVAARILARIADAQAHGLPAAALGQRALKFAAKGVAAASIERSVTDQAGRMARAKSALDRAHSRKPTGDEIEAGAEAMRQGVDGRLVSALALSAPSGRSLAVPLYVIGSLTARGLPADQALVRVQARLRAHASDDDMESLLSDVAKGRGNQAGDHDVGEAAQHGHDGKGIGVGVGAGAGVGVGAGGHPTGVPGNGGVHLPPVTLPTHPTHP